MLAAHDNLPPGLVPADNEIGWRMALDKLARFIEAGMERMMPNSSIARIAGAAFAVIASNAPGAAPLDSISSSSGSVTVASLGPSTLIAGVGGAWVLYAPTLSVECSPPRGCYAKTQRIHYDFSCSPRYIVLTERISMDLNGTIVKHEVRDAPTYTPSYDAGALRVLDTVCPLPNRD